MSKVLCGDAAEVLQSLPQGSASMCVTSPPYYGLRDYGEEGQIGIEPTPREYVGRLVEVFDEVYRVLADDGTLWLNIGDSYAGSGKGPMSIQVAGNGKNRNLYDMKSRIYEVPKKWNGIKPKDLIGIPWMLAFALRERGWYLRSDIIWHKINALPEAVKDRPAKCYEHIFLLAKSSRYYFDYEAIQEPIKAVTEARYTRGRSGKAKYSNAPIGQSIDMNTQAITAEKRKMRRCKDVWEVSTNSYRMNEHFAMFPERLIEPCILAGSKEGGVVLDPFFGSGTTGAVAKRLRREYIGIDLNARYLEKAKERIAKVIPEKPYGNAADLSERTPAGGWDDLTKKIKQDKEVGINPDFDEAEAGNPLCHACGTEEVKKQRGRPVKIGTEKHIRITDSDLTDKINLLMKIPGYGNFNKVINEALFYGLPILAEKICGDAVTQEERAALTTPRKSGSREEKFYAVVVQLLRETVLNVTINKSILSSLYNEKSEEIAKDRDRANRFDSGLMSDTPEYLERYEAEGIKKLRR